MSLVRTAVIGVGYLGRFHAQKQRQLKGVDFVGVFDTRAEVAQSVAEELETRAWLDYRDLIGHVDAVVVAASTSSHYELVKFFLQQKIHVFVEKPITTSVEEGRELVALAEAGGVKLQVGHVERFNPALRAAQEKLSQPLFVECQRLAPFKPRSLEVDVILDLMIHDLDLVLSLVKSKPKKISAVGTPVITNQIDIANARIEFVNGAVANITASRVSNQAQRKVRVFQPAQYLSIDFGEGEVKLISKAGDYHPGEALPLKSEIWNLQRGDALLAENQAFIEAIQEDRSPIVSGQDGVEALVLAEQIIREIG